MKLQLDSNSRLGDGLHAGSFTAFHAARRAASHTPFHGAGFFLAFFALFVVALVSESGGTGEGKQSEGEQGIFHGKQSEVRGIER